MPLYESDLKLMQSAEMSDFATGGGPMSNTEIVDGELYNMFGPKSELDTVLGRVKLRGGHAAIRTATTDQLSGAHLMIAQAPVDDNVEATLFSTGNPFDRRTDYQDFIESYSAAGPKTDWYVWGRQLEGQKVIQLWGYPSAGDLELGEVYCLIQDEAQPDEQRQYVRVTKTTRTSRQFSDGSGIYTVSVLVAEITARLSADFAGVEPARVPPSPRTVFRTTYPASAAVYYGIRPLVASASVGDLEVFADSIFNQLVPSAESPSAITDRAANTVDATIIPGASGAASFTTAIAIGPNAKLYLGSPFVRESLSITAGATALTDRNGQVYSGGTTVVGTVDYAAGSVSLSSAAPILS